MSVPDGTVAIVTGAAVGVGREVAVALGRRGCRVAVNYSKSKSEAEATVVMVEAAGGEAFAIRADVAVDSDVIAMVKEVVRRWERVDVLVNNAGITVRAPFPDLDALTDEVWDRLLDVNIKGAFHCCKAVARPMRAQGRGSIVNIGTVSAMRPAGSSLAYCVSKAGLHHMSQCLAIALAPEIRVNTVAPGFIDNTRWNEHVAGLDDIRRSVLATSPLQRIAAPDDVAGAVVFLALDAPVCTGTVTVVDGGRQLAT